MKDMGKALPARTSNGQGGVCTAPPSGRGSRAWVHRPSLPLGSLRAHAGRPWAADGLAAGGPAFCRLHCACRLPGWPAVVRVKRSVIKAGAPLQTGRCCAHGPLQPRVNSSTLRALGNQTAGACGAAALPFTEVVGNQACSVSEPACQHNHRSSQQPPSLHLVVSSTYEQES